MNYVWTVVVLMSLFALLAMSLNLVVGYTGALSLSHAAFYGIGAYAASLLMLQQVSFLPALLLAVAFTAAVSLVAAVPAMRLRGDYFVLSTLGLQMIVFGILYNAVAITNGPYGVVVPVPSLFGIRVDTPGRSAALCLGGLVVAGGVLWLVIRSPFGRALRAVRADDVAVAALGKNVVRLKTVAFALSAGLAGLAGALFAGTQRFIEPTSFSLPDSILMLSMVAIGGAGTFSGPIIGAVGLVLLRELLRFLELPDAYAANVREAVYGGITILLMRFRPQGVNGVYGFD
jgi:branched-chain amino acid transport system permease protein